MRRGIRLLGTLLTVAGALTLIWALVVWRWQDPFTALYTHWQQGKLTRAYERRAADYRPRTAGSLAAERRMIAGEARDYRKTSRRGEGIGRIHVPRLGLDMTLVNGTDHETLKKGPGRDLRSFMPGENRLVYVAGHRTTYLAPFSHIERLRPRDTITIEVPYGTFVYAVTGHRVVASTDLSVLRSPRHELLELQACHPRFFATHRYIALARLVRVEPRGGTPYGAAPGAEAAGGS